jgi:tetratricopeptide (TPR) repeat protein
VELIGRDAEIARLSEGLERARAGRGQALVVVGEPGIGKTRLLEEIGTRAAAAGFRVAWGRSWDGEGAPPLDPWAQVLLALDRGDLELAGDARRLGDRVAMALGQLATEHPLLLLLDDLQAADTASLELLRFLVRALEGRRILVVAAARRVEARQRPELRRLLGDLDEIRLTGLDEPGVARLMAEVARGLPPGGLSALVHRRTDGNPLFVRETARLLAAQPGGDPRTASELPLADKVTDVIEQRTARLGPEPRRALAAAAVIGREIPLAMLAAILERTPAETLAALQPALDAELVIGGEPGRFAFATGLYRSVIYRSTPVATRGALHLAAARWLEREGGGSTSELAHHFAAAAAVADVAAERMRYARLAGEHAAELRAFDEAARHYETALSAAPPDERLGLTIRLGEMAQRAGQLERGRQLLERAIPDARGETLARLVLTIAERPPSPVRPDESLSRLLEQALAALPTDASPLRARLLARRAAELVPFGDPALRERLGREALTIARRTATGVPLGEILIWLTAPLATPDNLDERLAFAAEVIAIGEQASDAELELDGRRALTLALLERDGPAAAGHELARCQELAEPLRDARHGWQLALDEALLDGAEASFADAERRARRALGLAQDTGDGPLGLLSYLQVMAMIRREQGRLAELEPSVLALRAEAPRWDGAPHLLLEIQLERGDRAAAAATFADLAAERFADVPRDGAWLGTLVTLAEAALRLDARAEIAVLRDALAPYADRHATRGRVAPYLGPIALVLGRLAAAAGDRDAAIAHLERAVRIADAVRYPSGAARAEWALAELGRADRSAAEARFERLGLRSPLQAPVAPPPPPPSALATVTADGDGWVLGFAGRTLRLRDVKGLRYLAALAARPGTELHVVQLIAHAGGEPLDLGDAGEKLDARALAEYRRRLTDLADALQDAESHKDALRAQAVQGEIDRLEDELAAAVGLGGRVRRAASAVERMRQSVTKRLRDAVKRAADKDPALGDHLERSLRTGIFCAYDPVVSLPR